MINVYLSYIFNSICIPFIIGRSNMSCLLRIRILYQVSYILIINYIDTCIKSTKQTSILALSLISRM